MRTTMNKLILASLLLSTALLAAGSAYVAALYFPHVATSIPWQTEIAIINTSDRTVTGNLAGLSDEGQLVETKNVNSIPCILEPQGNEKSFKKSWSYSWDAYIQA